MYARTNNTCVFVCTYANTRPWNCPHTCRFIPHSTGRLPTDCSCMTTIRFLNISIRVFLFTSPQRSLVSSDLPPACIRKERLYCPAHCWYLSSLQALGANPSSCVLPVSPLVACVCVCVYEQTYASTSDNPTLAAFPDLLCARWEQDSGP